ncbi:VanZ family protein [Clostridium tagluense]|nr:VanZ family protein [Clostridium tagluense]MCB2317723.1 VanZ family protein [Clostridium tagluense]
MGQFILNVGVLDIDDIILNTLGCILGFIIYKVVKNF